jgi:hypothetical protein
MGLRNVGGGKLVHSAFERQREGLPLDTSLEERIVEGHGAAVA